MRTRRLRRGRRAGPTHVSRSADQAPRPVPGPDRLSDRRRWTLSVRARAQSIRLLSVEIAGKGRARGFSGRTYVADEGRIWRFEPDGSKTPIAGSGTRGPAGDGGPATAAQLGGHGDFGFDAAGNLYLSEYDNGVRIVTPDGRIDTLAGIGREGYLGDGGPARAAAFGAPHGLDVLPDGTVIVADSHNGVIRRIDGATRIVTTVAGGFSAPVGVEARADGSIYVADASLDHVVRIGVDGSRSIRRIDARTGRMTTLVRP